MTADTAGGCAGGLVKIAAAGLDAVEVNMSSSLSLNNPCPAIEVKTADESINVDGLSRQYEGVETRDKFSSGFDSAQLYHSSLTSHVTVSR